MTMWSMITLCECDDMLANEKLFCRTDVPLCLAGGPGHYSIFLCKESLNGRSQIIIRSHRSFHFYSMRE